MKTIVVSPMWSRHRRVWILILILVYTVALVLLGISGVTIATLIYASGWLAKTVTPVTTVVVTT